jgi:hypothetical protein
MLVAILVWLVSAPGPEAALDKAQEVLTAARQAAGVTEVRGLSLKADVRRLMPAPDGTSNEVSGEVRVDALLPGRYKRAESLSAFPGAPPFAVVYGLDGESAWTQTPPAAHGGGMVVVRVRPQGDGPSDEQALRRRLQLDYARFGLAALLATDAAAPLELRHVAVAEAPEGKADVLEVTGPDGFAARLFVDAATRRPLMMTYRDRRPRAMVRRLEGPPPQPEAGAAPGGSAAPPPLPPAEAEEVTLHLDDFRRVQGATLPHRFTISFAGTPAEEWTVKEYTLNPPLEPSAFRKK